jgi:serine/threonine-protein kinase RsbW
MAGEPSGGCSFDPEKLVLKLKVTLAADRDAIELALSEALANAVVHGAKADPKKIVECDVVCDETRGMLIVVRDPGPGFDPNSIPSPVIGQNIYSNHGRGIFLINELMDEVQFKNNGKEIHMLKR